MIEINLLPGSTKRASGRSMPRLGGRNPLAALRLPSVGRSLVTVVGAWTLALAAVGWMYFSTTSRAAALNIELEAALRDSTRYALQRAQGDSLAAQEAIIAQKLQLIQAIDSRRYVWPHILDEVSAALPAYVWLLSLSGSAAEATHPQVRMTGMAGTTFALTHFMEQLEASPFLQSVRLISSEQQRVDNRTVHTFALEMTYAEPPPEAIQTTPLFGTAEEN
jgi:Tfp pilus assembly protein PilN